MIRKWPFCYNRLSFFEIELDYFSQMLIDVEVWGLRVWTGALELSLK